MLEALPQGKYVQNSNRNQRLKWLKHKKAGPTILMHLTYMRYMRQATGIPRRLSLMFPATSLWRSLECLLQRHKVKNSYCRVFKMKFAGDSMKIYEASSKP